MRLTRIVIALAVVIVLVIAWGEFSGRQPNRDAVAAAESELGIKLETRHVDVGEVSLHVVFAGPADGEPVVLLHGFPEFWFAWRYEMARLADAGYRVIVPDQRGYNLSDKPESIEAYRVDTLAADIARLITELGFDSAYVAAHDWGGGVAWRLAINHPQRVRRLAMIDTPHPRAGEGFESKEETVSWYRTFMQLPWIPEWVSRAGNYRLLVDSLRRTSKPGTFPDEVMDQFRSAWDRDGARSAMTNWYRAAFRFPPQAEGTQRVALPTLMILAAEDAFIPADMTRRSMCFLDDARLVELDTGTHWVVQEEPEIISQLLADFFGAGSVDAKFRPATTRPDDCP